VVAVPQAGVAGEWPDGIYESELRVASFQHGFFGAMANRVGQERNLLFNGTSLVTDPSGRIVAQAPSGNAIILMASIDLDKCGAAPARDRFLADRRPDQYEEGAVRLASSIPVHRAALEEAGGEDADGAEAAEDAPSEASADAGED
jgi:N-carbamoylputrescine amidase